MKSFFDLNEALPPPMPMGGAGLPTGGGLPPPPPPMPMGGGGMGLGGPSLGAPPMGGGDQQQQQPIPVKTIDAMDVWNVLREAMKDMDKHDELNIKYKAKKEEPKPKKKKSSLMS